MKYSYNVIFKITVAICVIILSVNTLHTQANPFIDIIPLDKDHFEVNNIGGFPIDIYIDDVLPKGMLLSQNAEKPERFSNKKLKYSSKLRIRYPKEYYDTQIAYFKSLKEKYKDEYDLRVDIDDAAKDYDINTEDENDRPMSEGLDRLLNAAKNGILDFMDYQALKSYVFKMKKLIVEWDKYDAIYAASNAAGRYVNQYSTAFNDIYLKPVLKKEAGGSRSVISQRYLNFGLGLYKASLGDNWDSKGSFRGIFVNTSWEASFGQKILPDINWGGGEFYSSLFLGVAYDHFVHDLNNVSKDVYVGTDYVDNATQDFYRIASEKETTLRTNHFSVNLLLHNYVFNSIFVDIGAGYNLHNSSTIHFNRKNDKNEDINHLSGGNSLSKTNYRDVIDFNEQSPWYGMVRVGLKVYFDGDKSGGHCTFFLSSKLQNRTLEANDNYKLYEEVDGSFQILKVMEDEKLFYQISFGVGFSM